MHVMLDLETVSSNSNAAILLIGACAFDLNAGVIHDKTFYCAASSTSIDSCSTTAVR